MSQLLIIENSAFFLFLTDVVNEAVFEEGKEKKNSRRQRQSYTNRMMRG